MELGGTDGRIDVSSWRRILDDREEDFLSDFRHFGLDVDGKLQHRLQKENHAEDCAYVFGVYQSSLQDVD